LSRLTCCRVGAALFTFAIIFPVMAWAQQAESTDADSPVIPPAPLIQKRNPNAISIPVADSAKYQQQPAASTNVKVAADATSNAKPASIAPSSAIKPSSTAAAATNVKVAADAASNAKPASTPLSSAMTQSITAGATVSTNAKVVSTNAKVGSSFGYRRDPFTRREKFHSGCDIKAHWGQPVGASIPGTVQFAGWYHGYGNMIIVEHGGGVATHYAHLSSFAVEPGQHVDRGSIIGYAGSTGRATSPHLHYEVRIDGSAVNPLDPIALEESSEFFKNVVAARLSQPPVQSQAAAPAKAEPTKAVSEPAKVVTTDQGVASPVKAVSPVKAASPAPVQPTSNDSAMSQERPRRVTSQK